MKTVILCPSCNHQMRIPSDKYIRLNCTQCKAFITANQGQVVSFIRNPSYTGSSSFQNPPPQNTSTSRSTPTNSRSSIASTIAKGILVILVFMIGTIAYSLSNQEKMALSINSQNP